MRQARFALLPLLMAALLLALLPGLAAAYQGSQVQQEQTADQPAEQTAEPTPVPDDWSRIQDAGKIVFGTAADYPPFEYYNSKFELDGFDIALAKAIGEQLGLEVQFKDYAFDGLVDAVHLGAVDGGIAAISVTPDRQQQVDFSNLYYIGNSVAMASDTFTRHDPLGHRLCGADGGRAARDDVPGAGAGDAGGLGRDPAGGPGRLSQRQRGDRGPAQRQPGRGADGREDGRAGDEERQTT